MRNPGNRVLAYKYQYTGDIDRPEELRPLVIRPVLSECSRNKVESNSNNNEKAKALKIGVSIWSIAPARTDILQQAAPKFQSSLSKRLSSAYRYYHSLFEFLPGSESGKQGHRNRQRWVLGRFSLCRIELRDTTYSSIVG
jgi:hypothetical protein